MNGLCFVCCFVEVSVKFGCWGYCGVMRWQYKVSLFLLVLSQVVFFGFGGLLYGQRSVQT